MSTWFSSSLTFSFKSYSEGTSTELCTKVSSRSRTKVFLNEFFSGGSKVISSAVSCLCFEKHLHSFWNIEEIRDVFIIVVSEVEN